MRKTEAHSSRDFLKIIPQLGHGKVVIFSCIVTLCRLMAKEGFFLPTQLTSFLATLPSAGETAGVDCALCKRRACMDLLPGLIH